MTNDLARVIAHTAAKPAGGGHLGTCPCPGHETPENTLSIAAGKRQAVVVNCLSGRHTGEEVLRELRRAGALDSPTPAAPPRPARTLADLAPRYGLTADAFTAAGCTVENGAVRYPTTRPDGSTGAKFKTLARRGPDNRRTCWHLKDDSKPGFFPASSLTGDDVLVVTGGEEKALAGLAAGFRTVTYTTGEGSLKPEAAAFLVNQGNREFIVAMDADEAGRKGAKSVAEALRKAGAASVRVCVWPDDAPKGKDLNDILRDDGPDALRQFLDAAPAMEDTPTDADLDAACAALNATEQGNAERLHLRHGHDLRFCYETGHWYVWDGCRWKEDSGRAIDERMQDTARAVWREVDCMPESDDRTARAKWASRGESRNAIRAGIDLAKPRCAVDPDALDSAGTDYLLNVRNGTVDLRTGELRPHDRADHITLLAPVEYDPAAKCPRFLAFVRQILRGDPELIHFLQMWLGACLTGDVSMHKLVIWYGPTARNGKSQLRVVVRVVLGDYYREAEQSTFLERRVLGKNAPRPDLLLLKGARFVVVNEPNRGERLDGAQIKKTTGGESDTARDNYQGFSRQAIRVTGHLNIITNDLPHFTGDDAGMVERLLVMPFDVHIPESERIPNLGEQIAGEEGPGILNWMLEGCRLWLESGRRLPDCEAVQEATRAYTIENNPVQRFNTECVRRRPGAWTSSRALFSEWERWRKENNETELRAAVFGKQFAKCGHRSAPRRDGKGWADIELVTAGDGKNINFPPARALATLRNTRHLPSQAPDDDPEEAAMLAAERNGRALQ